MLFLTRLFVPVTQRVAVVPFSIASKIFGYTHSIVRAMELASPTAVIPFNAAITGDNWNRNGLKINEAS